MKNLFAAALWTHLLCTSLQAGLTTYPDPPNAVTSTVFSLAVDGTPVRVMRYMDYHYAHFAFEGTVSLAVTSSDAITSNTIRPASLGIQGQVQGGTKLMFSMDQAPDSQSTPRYLVIQINNLEKLIILGDPPETNVPPPAGPGIFNVVTDYDADNSGITYTQPAIQDAFNAASAYGTPSRPGIVYVPPGMYKVRANLLLGNNVDVYLSPGSVLKSDEDIVNHTIMSGSLAPVLTVNNAENVTIRGRGQVDASGIVLMNLMSRTPPVFVQQSTVHPRRRIIRTNNNGTSKNVVIDGLMLKDASGWSLELKRTLGVEVRNVKLLNHKDIRWKIENDGINVCSSSNALVNQCFVMTIDDALCSKASDRVMGSMDNVCFSNNVVWTWAAGVKAGMQNDHPMNDVVFRNIDIIHCRRAVALDTRTSQDLGQTIPIEGVVFEDIRNDEIEPEWSHSNYDAVEFFLEDAPANNITIRNLRLAVNRPLRCGPNFGANNISFENLMMNSQLITNSSQLTFAGSRTIGNLSFSTVIPSVILSGPATHRNSNFEVTTSFSEPVTGLTAGDFTVTGGTVLEIRGGPSVYKLTVEPSSRRQVSITLPAGMVRNAQSLTNSASNSLSILGDPSSAGVLLVHYGFDTFAGANSEATSVTAGVVATPVANNTAGNPLGSSPGGLFAASSYNGNNPDSSGITVATGGISGAGTGSGNVLNFRANGGQTLSEAITTSPGGIPTSGEYFSFSLSTTGKITLALSEISFDFAKGGTPSDRGLVVWYSTDGFTGNATRLGSGSENTALILAANTDLLARNAGFTLASIPDTAQSVEFRFYSTNIAGNTVKIDNIRVMGALKFDPKADDDRDGLSNLLEYAFGSNLSVSSAGPIVYAAGGSVTTPGMPVAANLSAGGALDFRAIFGRRKDHIAAGLAYTVQFSADLDHWVNSPDTPTVLTGPDTLGEIEAASVPYPQFIATPTGDMKPKFFRIGVTKN